MSQPDAEIVQFDNVGLRYGTDKEILADISFTLYPGRFYFLTGASGAGKTSLLKLLYLAQRPSRGLIRLFGTDAITLPRERLPGFRRRIGVVFQDFRLVEHLSAFDNVALPLRVAGVSEKDIARPVGEMLDWVGLGDRQHARPATLSGGEQQRVAIARAVIARPDMLVADEPTGNVDPDMALKLMRLFESLNPLGTTVVVATHDVHLIRNVPESLIMRLDKGRLGDPTGALRYPPRRRPWPVLPPRPRPERGAMGFISSLWQRWRGAPAPGDPRLLPEAQLSGPMPWVIAIMISLTVVAAASGLALRNAARTASADLEGGVTVQIVSAAPAERQRQSDAALAVLRKARDVAEVRQVAQEDLNTLVEPWLGTRPGDDIEALPIPALIDVRLVGPATPDQIARLRALVVPVAPSARIDAQAGWLAPVFAAIGTLQWLAGGLIALLAFATIAAVLLASRNALGTHRETIEIVHMLGGTDRQIARVFQRSMAFDAAAGGLAGLLLGVIAIAALSRQFAGLGSGMVGGAVLLWPDWIVIALIPLAGVALAVLTARLTVLAALRRML